MNWPKIQPYLLPAGIVLVLLVAGASYLQSRDDRIRMEATLKAQGELIAKYDSVIKDLDKRMEEREEATRQQLQAYAATIQRVQTPAQVIREIPQYLPPLPVAPTVTETPEGKKQVIIPEEDLKTLFDFSVRCRACETELASCQADKVDLQEKVEAKQEQLVATEKQRDAAVKAAKGGGFWRRTGRALKWVGIGVLIGVGVAAL